MSLLSRIFLPPRGHGDWLFVGFVSLAVVVSGFAGTQKLRYRSALRTFAACAADADATCAASALETLRSVDAENVRTTIAQAEMRALAGETDVASSMLFRALNTPATNVVVTAKPRRPTIGSQIINIGMVLGVAPLGEVDPEVLAKLPPDVRADALLLSGDIAALQNDSKRAEARWTEAAGIVDEALVEPRRKRIATAKGDSAALLSSDLESLRDEFNKLFDAARSGSDGAAYAATALRTRARAVSPPLAAQKLGLAIDAADRCAKITRVKSLSQNAPTMGGWRRPDPPIPPSEADMARNPYLRSSNERQQAQYLQTLARWQSQEDDKSRARDYAESEIGTTANNIIVEAQALLKEGLALAASSSARASR